MNKTELEKAIKNGESVWACRNDIVYKVALDSNWVYIENDILKWYSPVNKILGHKYYSINELYKTKAEAEHYLNHANIFRVEQLPFLTWEEFKSGKNITFKAKNGHEFLLKAKQESIYLWWLDTNNIWKTWDLTEDNFYKAYDEAVKFFNGE